MNNFRGNHVKSFNLRLSICCCGDLMECLFQKDNSWHLVKIIAVKKHPNLGIAYYVRFLEFDKRLDEWVGRTKLRELKHKRKYESVKNKKLKKVNELEQQHDELNKIRNIEFIVIGKYRIKTWYFSPYPEKYNQSKNVMFICEFCLKYMLRGSSLKIHMKDCNLRHPPGNEIYRHEGVSIFEVDGVKNKVYCQNLCLLCKLFLDHKTLYFGVGSFIFYLVCEYDDTGYHIVGFFSKEKNSTENFNLACILTFPFEQKKGWGRFLISISYELTKREKKTGSPEKPLSDLGKKAYISYWTNEILKTLSEKKCLTSLRDISSVTGIDVNDVVETVKLLNLTQLKKPYYISQKKMHYIKKLLRDYEKNLIKFPPKHVFNPSQLKWKPEIKQRPKRKARKRNYYRKEHILN